jgi:hypothetical protein
MKIVIPVELDLAMLIRITASDNDVAESKIAAILSRPAFRAHIKAWFENNEDVGCTIDEYLEELLDNDDDDDSNDDNDDDSDDNDDWSRDE